MRQYIGKPDAFSLSPGRQHRRNRRPKMPRIDFIQCQHAVQRRVERSRIVAAAGANRFERRHIDAMLTQITRE